MDRNLYNNLDRVALTGLWLAATAVATFFALLISDAVIVGDMVIPMTNDSFYHARRIIDAAVGDTGLYQFENRIDPPEGIWIPWPWGYDFLMAKLLQVGLWFRPGADPMAIIAYVPVAWISINAALFLAAANALGLSGGMRVLVMVAFALSPFTQLLHGMAMVDHHFVEHSFVLLGFWLGMLWLDRPAAPGRAIALGVALGAAPAFHNGLFVLQLVPLATLAMLWLRGTMPPRRPTIAFASSLVAASLLAVLPSAPFRAGMFSFGYLSWFHLYVGICTAVVAALLAWKPYSGKQAGLLAGIALVLGLPMLTQFLLGATFVTGGVSVLESIGEAQSPFRQFFETLGPMETVSYYSWLLLLVPFLLAYTTYRFVRETAPPRLYFAAASALGLSLMLLQFRFHYFGLFALLAGIFLICDRLRDRFSWHRGMVFIATFGLLVLALQPVLRQRLFSIYAVAADPEYQYTMTIYLKLGEVCATDPGLVLANNDDGNAILYHSDCSVIANNFFLDAADEARADSITALMKSTPADLLNAEPEIRYLFIRGDDFSIERDGDLRLDTSSPMISELFLSEDLPPGFELVTSVFAQSAPDAEPEPHARLYRLGPDAAVD